MDFHVKLDEVIADPKLTVFPKNAAKLVKEKMNFSIKEYFDTLSTGDIKVLWLMTDNLHSQNEYFLQDFMALTTILAGAEAVFTDSPEKLMENIEFFAELLPFVFGEKLGEAALNWEIISFESGLLNHHAWFKSLL